MNIDVEKFKSFLVSQWFLFGNFLWRVEKGCGPKFGVLIFNLALTKL
jgi:hypothetical protein